MFLDSELDRLLAVGGFDHVVAGHFEQPAHHEAAVLKIFYYQEEFFASHLSPALFRSFVNEKDLFLPLGRMASIRYAPFGNMSN